MAELNLGKQVGPLPLGAWIAVVGGGLGLAYFMNRGQADADRKATQLTESGVGVGAGGFTPAPPFAETEEPVQETNDTWGRKASDWLIAQGHDPTIVVNAVARYLSGEKLNIREKALLNSALARFGVQPEPLPPADVTPSPDPNQPERIGLTLTIQPSTAVTRGQSVRWAGFVVGANRRRVPGRVVIPEYRNTGSTTWIPYPTAAVSRSNGEWVFSKRAAKTRQWRFRLLPENKVVSGKVVYVR